MRNLKSIKSGGVFLSGLGKMFSFSMLLSLFLVLQFVGCSNSDNKDKDNPPNRVIYSAADGVNTYILKISKEETVFTSKAAGYNHASGDFYTFEYNGSLVSYGTIEVNGSSVLFKVDASVNTFNATLDSDGNISFENNEIIQNSGAKLNVPALKQETGLAFSEGFHVATPTTAAYIYFRLPRQYDYSRTVGEWVNGKFIVDDNAAENSVAQIFGDLPKTDLLKGEAQNDIDSFGYSIANWVTEAKLRAETPNNAGLKTGCDTRDMYTYYFASASDGFSWRTKGNHWNNDGYVSDMNWSGELEKGYITTLLDGARTRFLVGSDKINGINQNGTTSGSHRNVNFAEHVFAFRTINVQIGDSVNADRSNIVRIQTGATKDRMHTNYPKGSGKVTYDMNFIVEDTVQYPAGTDVIGINVADNFLTDYVIANIADITTCKFVIVGVDGYSQNNKEYTYDQIKDSYFLPGEDAIRYLGVDSGFQKIGYPVTIIIKGDAKTPGDQSTNKTLKPPAFGAAYR